LHASHLASSRNIAGGAEQGDGRSWTLADGHAAASRRGCPRSRRSLSTCVCNGAGHRGGEVAYEFEPGDANSPRPERVL
jgi:hypothetical protein